MQTKIWIILWLSKMSKITWIITFDSPIFLVKQYFKWTEKLPEAENDAHKRWSFLNKVKAAARQGACEKWAKSGRKKRGQRGYLGNLARAASLWQLNASLWFFREAVLKLQEMKKKSWTATEKTNVEKHHWHQSCREGWRNTMIGNVCVILRTVLVSPSRHCPSSSGLMNTFAHS